MMGISPVVVFVAAVIIFALRRSAWCSDVEAPVFHKQEDIVYAKMHGVGCVDGFV